MNKHLSLTAILFFVLTSTYGQSVAVSKFVPKNYSILQLAKGNLNLDKIEDVVLVLNKNGEDSLSSAEHPLKRKVLLLIGQKDRSYKLAMQHDNLVYYYNYDLNFKDAFVDLKIDNGQFSINHYGGFAQHWGRTSQFKYDPTDKNWYLLKDEFSTFEATDPENTEKETILTEKEFGKIALNKFDIYKTLK